MADLTASLYAADGSLAGEVELNPEIFGIEPNQAVMHQVVTAQRAAHRGGNASTKTRAEVRGGGRKPWRQKGLGRARHGSSRSPIWVGGGVAFGPKPRDYAQRTPKKMRRLALLSALSTRASEEAIKVVEPLDWDAPKTKNAANLLATIGATGKSLVVLAADAEIARRSFRNLPDIVLARPDHVTIYDVLWADTMVIEREVLSRVGGRKTYEVADGDFVREKDDGGDGQ